MLKFVIFLGLLVATLALPADYNVDDHAEELEHEFQGDMIISQAEIDSFNGLIADRYMWPNNIVPYTINMALLSELIAKIISQTLISPSQTPLRLSTSTWQRKSSTTWVA